MHYQVRLKISISWGMLKSVRMSIILIKCRKARTTLVSKEVLLIVLPLHNAVLHQQLIYFVSELFWTVTIVYRQKKSPPETGIPTSAEDLQTFFHSSPLLLNLSQAEHTHRDSPYSWALGPCNQQELNKEVLAGSFQCVRNSFSWIVYRAVSLRGSSQTEGNNMPTLIVSSTRLFCATELLMVYQPRCNTKKISGMAKEPATEQQALNIFWKAHPF